MRVACGRFNIVAIQIATNATRISVRRSARVDPSLRNSVISFYLLCFLVCAGTSAAQHSSQATAPPPVTFTAEQDHRNMMDQLGIKALRPGPSGNEADANHANYNEALANPYPNLPDVLTLKNGTKVTTPAMWWDQRRPEIVEDMEREVYGRIPKNVPKVTWTVKVT